MKVRLELSRKERCGLPKKFFDDVAKESLLRCGIDAVAEADEVVIGVALVSLGEIRELNRTYREKNRPTDILSFPEFRKKGDIRAEEGVISIGDLVLSPEYIAGAAREDRVSLEVEMAFIFSHGIFHLLGFRHSPRMFRLQDEIASPYVGEVKKRKR